MVQYINLTRHAARPPVIISEIKTNAILIRFCMKTFWKSYKNDKYESNKLNTLKKCS